MTAAVPSSMASRVARPFGWLAILRRGLVQAALGAVVVMTTSTLNRPGLAASGLVGTAWPFKATVFGLGAANGAFSIAAIASMMRLAGKGRQAREGVRMGLWGAAQALAFGLGGLVGTGATDLSRWLLGAPGPAYAAVFVLEAPLFVASAVLAARMGQAPRPAGGSRRVRAHALRASADGAWAGSQARG